MCAFRLWEKEREKLDRRTDGEAQGVNYISGRTDADTDEGKWKRGRKM